MNILITGGAGYLGSILTPKLVREGYHVTVVDTFMYDQMPFLDFLHLGKKNFKVIRKDYRRLTREFISSFDAVVHLAAIVGAPACDSNYDSWSINTTGLDLITAFAKRLIFPCTNSGYGSADFCTEETPFNPISNYGKQKQFSEETVLKAGGISLRLATLFGASPRMRLDLLVNDLVYRAITDKVVVLFESQFKRNYVHVSDAADAVWHSLHNFELMRANTYNVGLSDANLSKLELAKKIKVHIPELAILESDVNKDPDQRNYIVSNEKIEKTGWKAGISLDEGIEELIQTYQIIQKNQYTNL